MSMTDSRNANEIALGAPPSSGKEIVVRGARDVMGQPGLTRWTQLALIVGARTRRGSMTLVMPDGRRYRVNGREPGPDATIVVRRQDWTRKLLTGGNLSFSESYLDGDFDSPDLTAVTEWAVANEEMDEALMGKPWYRMMRRLVFALQRNSKNRARKNISYHYDLGNSFYSRWLDPSMTYSSARFTHPSQELEAAQGNKYRSLIGMMGLTADHHVLEIGCGWGGFACLAARETGCRVTGITISREQFEFASARVQREGLSDKVEIRLQDYRDTEGQFDGVASIEMFEAVGEQYWPVYFGKLRERLKPGRRAGLQIITIGDRYFDAYRGTMDFIQKYIFPGGMLPSPSALDAEFRRAGLRFVEFQEFGLDYARTLAEWRVRFRAAWPDIQPLGFDERFRRMWEYYLSYCEGGFRAKVIDVRQYALQRD